MSTISNEVREQVELYMSVLITGPMTLLGIGANLINFVIFLKQGVKDCLSVCLFALTISDFYSVLNGGAYTAFNILPHLNVDSVIDPFGFTFIMTYSCSMFYDISQGIIAFVTLERCLCVAMPLKFKDLFTFQRSLYVVIFLYTLSIGAYIPHFVTSGLHWRHDPVTNSSRIFVWLSDNRVEVDLYLNTFMHVTMPTLYQVLVLTSTHVMVIGLKRSTKFRERKKTVEKAVTDKEATKDHQKNNIEKILHEAKQHRTKDSSSSLQNRRVIKTVTALAVIFLVSNTVRLIIVYTVMSIPDLQYFQRFHNELVIAGLVLFVFQTINSSANTFVYYHFNPSFRSMFRSLFSRTRKDG